MVCDCPCRPTSASQVYIYIHMSMRFITVSMHLQVIGATVLCQSDLLSLLPQSCVNKVDYCLYVLANHRWHSSVTATMKLANIWLQKNRRRGNNFAWCDSSCWQIRGISPALRLFGDVDKFAKFLKSLPNIHQIYPNVFFFRQTFSIHLAITIQWQWCLLYFLYTYNSFPPQCCLSKPMASYYLYTYKSLLPLCGVSLNLQDIFCHSSVSIRLTFRMVYLHVPILYATVMSLTFLTTPWHPDVLCYHSTASVSLPFEFLVIIVLCPTISQLKDVATFIIIMEKKKNSFIKKYIYLLVVKTL